VGENYTAEGYVVTPRTEQLLRAHVKAVGGKVNLQLIIYFIYARIPIGRWSPASRRSPTAFCTLAMPRRSTLTLGLQRFRSIVFLHPKLNLKKFLQSRGGITYLRYPSINHQYLSI
jgi:hypothetical protein